MARPGIMLYFDILEPIRVLPDADKGRLLVAILEYGKDGVVPKFEGMLAMAWGFIQPRLDRDGESYENTKVQRKYAAFCKKRSNLNLPKIPFEEWQEMDEDERLRLVTAVTESERPVDFDEPRFPTTTTTGTRNSSTTTPTSTTIKTAISTAAAAAVTTTETDITATAADIALKLVGGELGKNVVILSEAQISDLLDRMGMDCFDYYVDKLSSFIINNDAKVKNHYETILKWWRQDSGLEPNRR